MKINHKIILSFLGVIIAIIAVNFAIEKGLGVQYGEIKGIISTAVAFIVGVILAVILSRYITKELKNLSSVAKVVSEGDLTYDIKVNSKDEIGELAGSFSQMVQNLRDIIFQVKEASDNVTTYASTLSASAEEMNASTEEIATTVEQIAKGAEQQSELIEKTSRVMREMANSINEIALRAKMASEAAAEASYTAQTGGKASREAMTKMGDVFDKIETSSKVVKGFGERTQEITKIVEVIGKIAQQTHLLALNATIEAARAGDYGRGFAVVAEEVRKLAEEAGNSAEQISKIVKEIKDESDRAINSMEEAIRGVNEGRDVSHSAGRALEDIVKVVMEATKKIQEISALTQEQTKGAKEMVEPMDEIAKVAEDNAASTEETSAATMEQTASMEQMAEQAQNLSKMSAQLKILITRFKAGESSSYTVN